MGFLAIVAPVSALGQNGQQQRSASMAADEVKLGADLVKTGLYVISGGGGNTLLRFSANGLILVDGKRSGNFRALMAQVRKINKLSDLPVRVLIVTDHHDAHSGNNAEFLAAGVAIIAQQNTRNRLPAYPSPVDGKTLAPVIGYDQEKTLSLGGIEVQLEHFGKARTDGDTVVYFVGQKTVAVGDLYTAGEPDPDFSAGGSLCNWSETLADVLRLDFDTVVPSDGPPVSRAVLEYFKVKIDMAVSRALALVRQGVPKDQFMARWKTDDLGWRFGFTGAQLDALYAELSRTP